jgi:CRP-like cAMP-binding protein
MLMPRAQAYGRTQRQKLQPDIYRPEPQQNHLLAAFSPSTQRRLFPHLELAPRELQSLIREPGRSVRHLYFPTNSIILMQNTTEDGKSTGVSVVGNEGVLGITLLLRSTPPAYHPVVQSAGYAFRLPKPQVEEEFRRAGEFNELLLHYTQVLVLQLAQTAVCNCHHSIDQQLSRWLCLSMDRLSHNYLTMTHEFISHVLDVRREGVTEAAAKLREMGAICYSRGIITVLDRRRLEQIACECYEVVRSETKRFLNHLPQHRAVLDGPAAPVVSLPRRPVQH